MTCVDSERLGCQCHKCAKDCCYLNDNIICPDMNGYTPGYVCPDFTPREEDQDNAPD